MDQCAEGNTIRGRHRRIVTQECWHQYQGMRRENRHKIVKRAAAAIVSTTAQFFTAHFCSYLPKHTTRTPACKTATGGRTAVAQTRSPICCLRFHHQRGTQKKNSFSDVLGKLPSFEGPQGHHDKKNVTHIILRAEYICL